MDFLLIGAAIRPLHHQKPFLHFDMLIILAIPLQNNHESPKTFFLKLANT